MASQTKNSTKYSLERTLTDSQKLWLLGSKIKTQHFPVGERWCYCLLYVQVLTDSGLGAGEAAVFRDEVSVVALTGQKLLHLSHLLLAALFGPLVHSESNICSVTGKLPPDNQNEFASVAMQQGLCNI